MYAESNAFLKKNDVLKILLLTIFVNVEIRSQHGLFGQHFKLDVNLSSYRVLMIF